MKRTFENLKENIKLLRKRKKAIEELKRCEGFEMLMRKLEKEAETNKKIALSFGMKNGQVITPEIRDVFAREHEAIRRLIRTIDKWADYKLPEVKDETFTGEQ